jgi:undecaprenyl pyrophosphate phosphatase UppP
MKADFSKVMSERTDKQLAEILTSKEGEYQADAVTAAHVEFQKRNLRLDTFVLNMTVEPTEQVMGVKKFEWYHKVLTILLPAIVARVFVYIADSVDGMTLVRGLAIVIIILAQYLIYQRLKKSGQTLVAAEFLRWVTYSYYLYIGLAILLALLISVLS